MKQPAVTPASNLSPARRAGELLFVSGQASTNDDGQIVPGTFDEEMERSIRNLERVLTDHGCCLADVVVVHAYVRDPADLAAYNERYQDFFSPPLPARTTLTHCLPDTIRFEIDAVAIMPDGAARRPS